MVIKEFYMGKAHVRIFETRAQMGKQAGKDIAVCIRTLLKEKEVLNIMFAAAPSQNEVLDQLLLEKDIDWSRINAFHMDEYIGISPEHSAGFVKFLRRKIFDMLPFRSINCIDCAAKDPEEEAKRYSSLLAENHIDICVLGVGETGHIAFNDPSTADFNDPQLTKIVLLDERSRIQQVNDGCFYNIEEVPLKAITVTIPGLIKSGYFFCSVPCSTKAEAIQRMFSEEISTACPSTILRKTPNTEIYLDKDSAERIL